MLVQSITDDRSRPNTPEVEPRISFPDGKRKDSRHNRLIKFRYSYLDKGLQDPSYYALKFSEIRSELIMMRIKEQSSGIGTWTQVANTHETVSGWSVSRLSYIDVPFSLSFALFLFQN